MVAKTIDYCHLRILLQPRAGQAESAAGGFRGKSTEGQGEAADPNQPHPNCSVPVTLIVK